MRHTLVAVACGLAMPVAIILCSYLVVYIPAARMGGYRLFSLRRWRAFRARAVECVGGPFDGESLPVSRRSILGIGIAQWPVVVFHKAERRYAMVAEWPVYSESMIISGSYYLRHMSDRYEWKPTGLEKYEIDAWSAA